MSGFIVLKCMVWFKIWLYNFRLNSAWTAWMSIIKLTFYLLWIIVDWPFASQQHEVDNHPLNSVRLLAPGQELSLEVPKWTQNESLTTSTRFVVKPKGVSNGFLAIFDWTSGVSMKTWGVERHQRGVNLPDKSNTAYDSRDYCHEILRVLIKLIILVTHFRLVQWVYFVSGIYRFYKIHFFLAWSTKMSIFCWWDVK